MNHLRRIVAAMIALAGAVLALAAAPAAFAERVPPPGCCIGSTSAPAVITTGGMPGWQITLIAVGAAAAGAALAVLLDRALAARKTHPRTA